MQILCQSFQKVHKIYQNGFSKCLIPYKDSAVSSAVISTEYEYLPFSQQCLLVTSNKLEVTVPMLWCHCIRVQFRRSLVPRVFLFSWKDVWEKHVRGWYLMDAPLTCINGNNILELQFFCTILQVFSDFVLGIKYQKRCYQHKNNKVLR